ncbi:hypothetical protein GGS20DRAFT_577765 [Poronia punctata]|nr:hypothetical protein GGS20DRAFT_577765 [Poronia punctata]
MTSNPTWDKKTSAIAVASTYADRIKGKATSSGSGTATAFASQDPSVLILLSRTRHHLESFTGGGVEMQFGVNHFRGFLLTKLLYPLLERHGKSRVVNLSSYVHGLLPVRFLDCNMLKGVDRVPVEERPVGNLAEVFARVQGHGYAGTVAYAMRVVSNLGREHEEDVAKAIEKTTDYWKNSDEGASTTLVAALDPALDECRGLYLADCQFVPCANHARDPDAARRLWALSEELIGEKFIVI